MANANLQLLHGLLYGNGLRFGQLSGDSRFIATLMGSHADYVPFMGPQIHDHAMWVAKLPARKYYWEPELLVNTQAAVDRWYGFDTYTFVADAYNFEAEALGAKFIYSDKAMPTVDISDPLIKEPADLDKIPELDPSKGRIPIGVEMSRLMCEKGFGILAAGFFCSPFSLMCQLAGYPAVIRAVKRDPGYAKALFEFVEDKAILPFLKAQRAAGVKQSFGPDAWACFPNITPEIFEEWVVPSAKRLAEKAKKLGITARPCQAAMDYCEEDPAKFDKQILFRCLDAASLLLMLNVCTVAMGRTQDLDPHWLQEYALSRGKGGKKIPIMASLNGRFVRDSSPQQIVDKVRQWVDVMGRDGRLTLFIGNVHADTPQVNVHTAVRAAHTLGRYPIAADLDSIQVNPPSYPEFDEWLKGQPEEDIIRRARE